ncbi:MAG: hypothetical protein M3Q23_11740 [Actinomycetota bacterium]|nr:hypothetical protein [Actinomycetota bacterium]
MTSSTKVASFDAVAISRISSSSAVLRPSSPAVRRSDIVSHAADSPTSTATGTTTAADPRPVPCSPGRARIGST